MPTLEQVLDIALQLPLEQQTILIEILRHRQIEARRAEIATNAQQAIEAFHQGQLAPQSADVAIAELRRSFNNEISA
ncbi:MAG: hypothetical protein HC769_02930 [Cyanobacteria bacterium CRU_2_1]|nr:hypothetical protein [Cyanobacteria bacterium RU_5_0]NJR57890.1 hypothetical protein [Cyanobacteria bacterium CRU_2_1]